MDITALKCPECRSSAIIANPDGSYFCNSCQTRLLLLDKTGQLVVPNIDAWIDCPRCGTNNDVDHFFCTRCGAPIRYRCPGCGTIRSAEEQVCGICGRTIDQAQLTTRRKIRYTRLSQAARSCGVGIVVLLFLLIIWVGFLPPDDAEGERSAMGNISIILCLTSPLVAIVVTVAWYKFLDSRRQKATRNYEQ
jgi:uncharacterized membrane protein YvbJ